MSRVPHRFKHHASGYLAGYSVKTANRTASENLLKPDIQSRIAELKTQRNDLVGINATYALNRLVEIDQMDVLDILKDDMSLKPISEWPSSWRRYLSGFDVAEMFEGRGEDREMVGLLKKIKCTYKMKNLFLLGKRHTGALRETNEARNVH